MAARKVGIYREQHYGWMRTDREYAREFEMARQAAIDTLEGEAHRRAVEGVQKPVYQKGMKVGEITEYSDNLLMFLLRAACPEKYRNNWKGERKAPEPERNPDLALLTDEELETLLAIYAKVRSRSEAQAGMEPPDPNQYPPIFQ
jgi:hypothetical protein